MEKNKNYSQPFQQKGYIRFDLRNELAYPELEEDLKQLQKAFLDLPLDPYAPETHRYRRYSRAIILPWNEEIHWLPNYIREDGTAVCEYYQGTFNNEYVEEYRAFPPLSDEIKQNRLLNKILLFDYKQTFWHPRELIQPIHIGVHFVNFAVKQNEVSVASPNCVHRDGEPFTFAHLITYHNVKGGINAIADLSAAGKDRNSVMDEDIFEEFILTEPLQSYGVCDRMVSHYVSPIQCGPNDNYAERGMLLIDYTPTVIAMT